jgi:four helix bundle protein
MALIEKFEDIRAWQEARKLTQNVYRLCETTPFAKDFGLKDQMRRAAVSGMANIAEGFDCESRLEFARFLSIAKRSVVEIQSLLYVALDAGYIDQECFKDNYAQAARTKALVGALKHAVRKSAENHPGSRKK